MIVRVLAISDTHVTSRMRLGGCMPMRDGEPLVLLQSRRTLRWAGDVARMRRVHVIAHAGDLFESARPSPAAMAVAINEIMAWTPRNERSVVMIPGNHDLPNGNSGHALLPLAGLSPSIVVADTPTRISYDMLGLSVYAIPYPPRGGSSAWKGIASETMAQLLAANADDARSRRDASLLLMHATLSGADPGQRLAPTVDVQVDPMPHWPAFDVQAVGHIHKRQPAPGTGGLPGYVGAPDRMGFGEEADTPGVVLFEIERSEGSVQVSSEVIHNPHARRFSTIDVTDDDWEASISQILAADEEDETVYRIRGELTEAIRARVSAGIRAARRAGAIVANATTVVKPERGRSQVSVSVSTSVRDMAEAAAQALNLDEVDMDWVAARLEAEKQASLGCRQA